MTRREATSRKLDVCIEVSNWALREGFDTFELRWAWDDWIEELIASRWGDDAGRTLSLAGEDGDLGNGVVVPLDR